MIIIQYPSAILRQKCQVIPEVTDKWKQTAEELLDCMYENKGLGLAAPQVGILNQLVVVDVSESRNQPYVMFNPEIIEATDLKDKLEGCLSFDGIIERVRSPNKIHVVYMGLDGQTKDLKAEGLLAQAIYHEVHHLNGDLFIDRMDQKTQIKVKTKLLKGR